MTYDHDSELARWGLRLFECDTEDHNKYIHSSASSLDYNGGYIPNSEYDGNISQYGFINQHDPYSNGKYETETSNIENDEIIAHTLQEELSQLTVTETAEFQNLQQDPVSINHPDWPNLSAGGYYSGIQKTLHPSYIFKLLLLI